MNNHIIRCVALALVVLSLAACGDDLEPTQPQDPKSTPMTFVVDYPGQTRATATDFERNDRIGSCKSRLKHSAEHFEKALKGLVFFVKVGDCRATRYTTSTHTTSNNGCV